jgi:glycosyltransferase involved in cell wall biosynthesis
LTRVLFLAESFHPVLGGGEQHIRLLATRLVAAGLPATVLTRRGDASWPEQETLDGVRIVRVPPPGPGRRGKYAMVPHAARALERLRDSFDVLVVRGTRVLGLPGLRAGRRLGKKVVLQCEVSGEMSGEIYTWGTPWDVAPVRWLVGAVSALRNRALRDADAFVAISSRTRDEFLAAGLPAERVRHIPHGVDLERFRPASQDERRGSRERLGLPLDRRLIVFTGRLLRGKGIEVLVDAFARLAKADPLPHLVLVGSGAGQQLSVEEALRGQVRALRLESRVSFVGRVLNVEAYLRAADLYAFPSFFEAMPLAVIEAAASGLACVATRIGGVEDVLEDDVSGLLVSPGDAPALAEAMRALLGDAPRAATLGRGARAAAEARFDLRQNLERYRALFQELAP